jgi:peptidoglycan/xylan/chitin deacetylase (PgdA/CDA1 family)
MPWKQGYTISDEIGLRDDELAWPEGARCAVQVVVDLNIASGPEGITAKDITGDAAVFGATEGLAQLRRVLDRHAIRATVSVPAVLARIRADAVRALAADGHEIAAGGFKGEDVAALDRAEEESRLARTTSLVAEAAGTRPRGWFGLPRPGDPFAGGTVSPHTIDLLIEAGYAYLGNGLADDIPHYWVSDFATRRALLTLPYYYHFDDQWFCMFPSRGTGLENTDMLARNWRAEFAAQYGRGRHFHMVVHPQHIGWANRIQALDDFLAHLRRHPGLWVATGSEIASHWAMWHPPATHLRLAPSIWQDYPGSLS